MWDSVKGSTSCNWEPPELRLLKKELADLQCNCSTCDELKSPQDIVQVDAAIQVGRHNDPLDRYIYGFSNSSKMDHSKLLQNMNMMEYFRNDLFCPNCFFIWDFLRGIKKLLIKDEESETKPNMTDKSTENIVRFCDSATSITNKSIMKLSSNISLCDLLSDSLSHTKVNSHLKPRSNHDRVTFVDDCFDSSKTNITKEQKLMHGNCFCLDNFIDSIRPPLKART